jgi:hypothetical protein
MLRHDTTVRLKILIRLKLRPDTKLYNNGVGSFPLGSGAMYPPKITDEKIRSVIRELTAAGKPPSGAGLRRELTKRYGSRGGVARIYQLLSAETQGVVRAAPGPIESRRLEQEVANLRELLKQVREREDAQQVYWSRQVGRLTEQIEALEPLVQDAAANGQVPVGLRQDVQKAEVGAGQLAVLLRAFGPSSGRGESS